MSETTTDERIDRLVVAVEQHTTRTRVLIAVCALALVAAALAGWAGRTAQDTASRAQDNSRADLVIAAGLRLFGCEQVNRVAAGVDDGFQALAALNLRRGADPVETSRALDALRRTLNPADCNSLLRTLDEMDREQARAVASLVPTIPIPPPTVEGYVPPGERGDG